MEKVLEKHHGLLKREPTYFSSGDYVLGIIKRSMASQASIQISHQDIGHVTVLPNHNAYYSSVSDMERFCRAPVPSFTTTPLGKDESAPRHDAGARRHVNELLWQAAFYASQGRLVESQSDGESVHIYDVIRFHHWPNLPRLPVTPNTMRICALLTRQPSSIVLVARKLGIDPDEVYQVYSAACSSGLVHVVSDHLGQAEIDEGNEYVNLLHGHGLLQSLFAKIMGL